MNPRGLAATDLAGLRPTRLGDPGNLAPCSFFLGACVRPFESSIKVSGRGTIRFLII